MVVERPELGEIPVRLLEVVPEYLLVLQRTVAVDAIRPADELLVKRCTSALQQSVVRRFANEDVVEAVRVFERTLRGVRSHELLAAERGKKIRDLFPDRVRSQLLDSTFREHIARDRGRLDDGALLATERVEARGEQRLDRGWDREVAETVEEGLRQEQRDLAMAGTRGDDAGGERRRDPVLIELGALDVEPGRISVKATTNEKMGALGRGEGIACWAVATIFGRMTDD